MISSPYARKAKKISLKYLLMTHIFIFMFSNFSFAKSATDVVKNIIDLAKTLDQKSSFKSNSEKIEAQVDFKRLTLDALSTNDKKANQSQIKQIQELLRKIITKTVYPDAPGFFKNVKISFQKEISEGNRTHVVSTITKNGKNSKVDFWLDSRLKVVDLAIEDERWVENIQSQFEEIISKNGIKDLIQRMSSRLKEIETAK